MKNYTLTINEQQANVMAKALELYARLGCGQIDALEYHAEIQNRMMLHMKISEIDRIRNTFTDLRAWLFGLYHNQAHGIRSEEILESNRVAYDIHQVIVHRLAWDNPSVEAEVATLKGTLPMGVYYQNPLATSVSTPLATIQTNQERV